MNRPSGSASFASGWALQTVHALLLESYTFAASFPPDHFLRRLNVSATGQDTLNARRTLEVGGKSYDYYSLDAVSDAGYGDISRLPFSLKVLLENLLRYEDGRSVSVSDIERAAKWVDTQKSDLEIAYRPARILLQDFTGVPAVVDLAAMRDAMVQLVEVPLAAGFPQILGLCDHPHRQFVVTGQRAGVEHRRRRVEVGRRQIELLVDTAHRVTELDAGVPQRIPERARNRGDL